jgi:membrane protein implicated in regulation of membrane protease activity
VTWESFYLVCFLVGFLLTVIAFLAGTLHLPHVHAHVHHVGGGGAHFKGAPLSRFNFATLVAFLTWFGGTGYLLERHTGLLTLVALGLATLSGLAGASVVSWFLVKVLLARERVLDSADSEMIGVLGRVSSPVRTGGTGEMIFSRQGARTAAPVRAEEGAAIPKGTEVIVTRYEKGIAYVRCWEEMTDGQEKEGENHA